MMAFTFCIDKVVLIVIILHCPVALGITPRFLWGVINATLFERRIPKHCTRLIFHNNATLADAEGGGNYTGKIDHAFVDLHAALSSSSLSTENVFPSDWDLALEKIQNGSLVSIQKEKADPCLLVASFVFNSVQYDAYLENDMKRRVIRHKLSDLFQFSTPIRNRHLIILRIAEEFNNCPKGPQYPTRLVPKWELMLFDFFHEARTIQGPFHVADEPLLRVTKETGKWRWLCDDVLHWLHLDKSCNYNQTCRLEQKRWDPLTARGCQRGFNPRQ